VLPDSTMPGTRWFLGGTLNYPEHALQVAAKSSTGEVAVIVIDDTGDEISLTWAELRAQVGAAQNGLRRLRVRTGGRVAALVPNTVHALIGFLAASLGAVWSSCSPEYPS
jgi:acetoacetyl-CoA synthetase